MNRAALVIIIYVCTSCASTIPQITDDNGEIVKQCLLPIAFAIASDTDEDLREQLRKGVLYWNKALVHDVMFDFGHTEFSLTSEYAYGFVMVGTLPALKRFGWHYKNRKEPCGRTSMAFLDGGCIARAKVEISIACASDRDILQTIVRHEIGHVLGLADTMDPTALMSGRLEMTMQHPVDANDEEIATVRKLYDLGEKE